MFIRTCNVIYAKAPGPARNLVGSSPCFPPWGSFPTCHPPKDVRLIRDPKEHESYWVFQEPVTSSPFQMGSLMSVTLLLPIWLFVLWNGVNVCPLNGINMLIVGETDTEYEIRDTVSPLPILGPCA